MRRSLFALLSITILFLSCKDSPSNSEPELPEGLLWSDEFDGEDWDRSNWYPELGASGWGNNEWQNYTGIDQNIEVSDGTLKIHALLEGNGQRRGDYTSARMLTYETFLYGRMEIRAKNART